jgi:hypothetical protein
LKRPPTFASTELDRARLAEAERLNAYERAHPWNPRGAPAAKPTVQQIHDPELVRINSLKAQEIEGMVRGRQMAQPQALGEPWQVPPQTPTPPAPAGYGHTVEAEINRRQSLLVEQFTSPVNPGEVTVPWPRLEQTRADLSSPNYASDPHVLRISEGVKPTWHVPIPGKWPPEAA